MKLILHAGPPKTGTTTLQLAFARLRDQLKDVGIWYPVSAPETNKGHHSLMIQLLDDAGTDIAITSLHQLTWKDAVKQARTNNCETILVSSEYFSSQYLDPVHFDFLRDHLKKYGIDEIHIILGLREVSAVLKSHYKQLIKYNLLRFARMKYDDAVAGRLQNFRVAIYHASAPSWLANYRVQI